MVGVVVGKEEGFAEDGLAGAVGKRREEVGIFVLDEFDHVFTVDAKRGDGFVPGFGVRGSGRFRPVADGPIGRDVFRVAGEFEDVPLSDAHVFEDFPGGVGGALRADALEFHGPGFDRVFKRDVRVTALEKFDEMRGEGFLFFHIGSPA